MLVKGDAAENVIDVMFRRENEGRIFEDSKEESQLLESLILIDRQSDMITPFATPYTYQSLVYDFFKFSGNQVEVDSRVLSDQNSE